jgi:anion-transporting  ArsA/GET3 family ATPase
MPEAPLLYVTGKGGTGKTAVAAALGTMLAAEGARTLVCELAGARHLADAFARPDAGPGPVRLSGNLWSLSLDPEDALEEWLRRQGGAVAAGVLRRSRGFAQFVAAAPGAKELITAGKLADLAGHGADGGNRPPSYDRVIVDAPSTGHALAMLGAPRAVSGVAPLGPVGRQARALSGRLEDPRSTGYIGVTLPEEMSLSELLELERDLRDTVGRGLDLIVVNAVRPVRFSDAEAERLRAAARRGASARLLCAVLAEHERARVDAAQVRRLRRRARAPVITLPFLYAPGSARDHYARLADELSHRLRPASQ